MSLAIDVDTVTAVLLADGWHKVSDETFSIDSYEYLWSGFDGVKVRDLHTRPNELGGDRDPMVLHGGGGSGVCASGFTFKESCPDVRIEGDPFVMRYCWVAGPLTAVLAVRFKAE